MFKKLQYRIGDTAIPFGAFLEQEKERSGMNWKEFEEQVLGGLHTSNYRHHGAVPQEHIFQQILERTGHGEEEFEIERVIPKPGSPAYHAALRRIGDFILAVNQKLPEGRKQLFSTTTIVATEGDSFCKRLAGSHDDRKRMLDELHSLDPKYESIELQSGHGGMPRRRKMTAEENDIIETALLEFMDMDNPAVDRNTYVLDRLKERFGDGYKRSRGTIVTQVRKMIDGKRPSWTFTRGSPHTNGKLERYINEKLDEIAPAGVPSELEQIVEADPGKERRTHFMSKAGAGHQQLLAYLLHKENYQKHLGDVELLWADFRREDTSDELWEQHHAALEEIVSLEQRERDAISFADHFLRCDMIFRVNGPGPQGGYIVVEVKQHAVDKSSVSESGEIIGYDNASRARQQLAGYTAVITDNIEYRNRQRGLADAPLKEEVRGVLIAYEIDAQLKNFLNSKQWRGAIEIPREEVLAYLQGKKQNADAKTEYSTVPVTAPAEPAYSTPGNGSNGNGAHTAPIDVITIMIPSMGSGTAATFSPATLPLGVKKGIGTKFTEERVKEGTSNGVRKHNFQIFGTYVHTREQYGDEEIIVDPAKNVIRIAPRDGPLTYFRLSGNIKKHQREVRQMIESGLIQRGTLDNVMSTYEI